jgi:hypothetical protein
VGVLDPFELVEDLGGPDRGAIGLVEEPESPTNLLQDGSGGHGSSPSLVAEMRIPGIGR